MFKFFVLEIVVWKPFIKLFEEALYECITISVAVLFKNLRIFQSRNYNNWKLNATKKDTLIKSILGQTKFKLDNTYYLLLCSILEY